MSTTANEFDEIMASVSQVDSWWDLDIYLKLQELFFAWENVFPKLDFNPYDIDSQEIKNRYHKGFAKELHSDILFINMIINEYTGHHYLTDLEDAAIEEM